jgi:hypothetical protein
MSAHTRHICQSCLCLAALCSPPLEAQGREFIQAHCTKREFQIPRWDGARLFRAVSTPKDTSRTYPMMLRRAP